LKKVLKLNSQHVDKCLDLIKSEDELFYFYRKIGWSDNQIILQLNKQTNYSFGFFEDNKLIAFIFGDLISIEKKSEYEILLLYVKSTKRYNGIGTDLISYILEKKDNYKLSKIFLDVAENNSSAIKFYKKHNFILNYIRGGYYIINNIKINALCFSRKL